MRLKIIIYLCDDFPKILLNHQTFYMKSNKNKICNFKKKKIWAFSIQTEQNYYSGCKIPGKCKSNFIVLVIINKKNSRTEYQINNLNNIYFENYRSFNHVFLLKMIVWTAKNWWYASDVEMVRNGNFRMTFESFLLERF